MFFGISYGELLVIAGVGAVVLGRKDLVAIAGTAGHLTGRAAGYVSTVRQRFAVFTNSAELAKLHKDVQGTMSQLETIRIELRRGVVSRAAYTSIGATLPAPGAPAAVPQQGRAAPGKETSSPLQHVTQQQMQSQLDQQLPGAVAQGVTVDMHLPAAAAATQEQQPRPGAVVQATPLPALSSIHFAVGTAGASASPSLVGDQSFDTAAYAAYQALFDVPAGRHAPALERNSGSSPAAANAEEQQMAQQDVAVEEHTIRAPGSGPGQGPRVAEDQAVEEETSAGFAAFLKTAQGQRMLQEALREAAIGQPAS